MTRRPGGRLVWRRCRRCRTRFRVVVGVRGGRRIYCSAQCSQNQRQEWFQARFREETGMTYRAWRVKYGFAVVVGGRLITIESLL